MAKRAKPKSSAQKLQKDYTRFREQVIEKVQKWEEAGYTVPKSLSVPKVPKTIKQESVKKLRTILNKKSSAKVISETREELRKARGISKRNKYTDEMFQEDLTKRAEERRKEKEQETERIQPKENEAQATIQILEALEAILDNYDPRDWFRFGTTLFEQFKQDCVARMQGMLSDAIAYLDDYSDDTELPETVIKYAAYLEHNALLLKDLIETVAFKESGGKDHRDDISNMNKIQEILLGSKLSQALQISINDVMGF